MLQSLHIENLAVIKRLDLEPCSGFTVLTGETGAGKSVIIDSISFLLGRKLTRDLIRSGEKTAMVSALFTELSPSEISSIEELGITVTDGELMIERTRSDDGKTVCRIGGRAVTKQQLTSVGELLVSLHGQNDTRSLESPEARTNMIDSAAHNSAVVSEYAELYENWSQKNSELAACRKSEAEKERMRDMLEYQIKDISSASLRADEEEALLSERTRLQSSEKIKKYTDVALKALYMNEKGITAPFLVSRASDAVSRLITAVPELAPLNERLISCKYELDDIASEIENIAGEVTGGPDADAKLDKIESRLETISKLKRKYGSSVNEILAFLADAEEKLYEIDSSDERAKLLTEEIAALRVRMDNAAEKLTASRKEAAAEIGRRIKETLGYLEMPKVEFSVAVTPAEAPGKNGYDNIDFLLSANPGEAMKPLSECASGGELSRVMLAVKCALADADGISTLIFDEIDTGISGRTSRKVGLKLAEASKSAQVLCVTHSAQIASLADVHLRITKSVVDGRSETSISALDFDGRVAETARILGGINVSDAQRQAAVDMITKRDE
ncbi:MAG: DNA repair protein RecN [Clostridia bacterium]|nr:DNA repair protein RecN [Clostridia bacterium]